MASKKSKSAQLLQRAYDLKSSADAQKLYRDWAATYDETMGGILCLKLLQEITPDFSLIGNAETELQEKLFALQCFDTF